MRFSDSFLDAIRDRVPVSTVIGPRVTWDRRKTNASRGDWWACCPFHGEKSPSFHCEDKKGRYHCFGCGASGDHFRFLTEHDGLSFPEAVQLVAEMAGVPMPARDPEAEKRDRQRASLQDVMEMAAAFFEQRLQAAEGAKARAYLRDRALTPATQGTFRLGYAPDSRNALKEFLAAGKGIDKRQVEACGLVVFGDDVPVSYDRFRDRIMFPIPDSRGRIIAFGGRALSPDAPAKYLNSPETELFHKGNVLYNFARARPAVQKDGTVIAVEGYMDVIALAQAGFDNVVAPLGTALTENQLELLWRMTPEPLLCFDGDQAGLKAAWRAAELALPMVQPGRSIRFALLPEGQDPDDLVRAGGTAAFRGVLDEARPLADILWLRETAGGVFDTPERRAELEKRLRDLTARIRDESLRFHYSQDMRERVQTFFGRERARPLQFSGKNQKQPAGGQFSRGGIAAGRLAVSDSLARSAMVKRSGGVMPLRETVLVVALGNHPVLIDENFEQVEVLELAHPELKRLHAALMNAAAHGEADGPEHVAAAIARAGLSEAWERAEALVRRSRVWPALREAALEDAREAFRQALSLNARARELRDQRVMMERALAEAMETGQEQESAYCLDALSHLNDDIAHHERQEALVEGFGVASGRSSG